MVEIDTHKGIPAVEPSLLSVTRSSLRQPMRPGGNKGRTEIKGSLSCSEGGMEAEGACEGVVQTNQLWKLQKGYLNQDSKQLSIDFN